ncbi:MAG: acyltransferase [Betaproteobacteria bacterium]
MSAAVAAPRIDLFSRFDLESTGNRIPAMEGLRAYAVVLTFCVHYFGAFMLQFRGLEESALSVLDVPRNTDRLLTWLHFSQYGVYLFFILSGFLICRLVGNAKDFSYARFLARRFRRIYPAFLLALPLGIAVFSLYAGWAPFSWIGVLGNVLLLNGIRELGIVPFLHQTWSLFYEIVFYLVFPALLLLRPVGVWGSPWALALAGAALVYIPFMLGWGQAMFLLFFAGATAARFDDAQLAQFARRVPEAAVVVLYLAVSTAISLRAVGDHAAIWLYSVTGTLFVIQACHGTGHLNRLFAWRPLRRIGNVSYSLFLTHTIPVFFVVYVFGPRWFTSNGLGTALLGGAIALAAALALAGALFLIAERPYFAAHQRKPT